MCHLHWRLLRRHTRLGVAAVVEVEAHRGLVPELRRVDLLQLPHALSQSRQPRVPRRLSSLPNPPQTAGCWSTGLVGGRAGGHRWAGGAVGEGVLLATSEHFGARAGGRPGGVEGCPKVWAGAVEVAEGLLLEGD